MLTPSLQFDFDMYFPAEGWFTPADLPAALRRPRYACERLLNAGYLEKRFPGGVSPTPMQITTAAWERMHEYRRVATAPLPEPQHAYGKYLSSCAKTIKKPR